MNNEYAAQATLEQMIGNLFIQLAQQRVKIKELELKLKEVQDQPIIQKKEVTP